MFEGRVAVWQQTATGEIKRKLNDPLGDSENVGATRRRGIDVQLSARPVTGLSLWGALSWQKAVDHHARPGDAAIPGQRDRPCAALAVVGRGRLHRHCRALRLSLWAGGQSDYWLTTANSAAQGKFGGYAVLNAEIAYELDDRSNWRCRPRT